MRERKSARVILFDEADRVLLIQARDGIVLDPARPNRPPYWITPGGEIEPGEAVIAAAERELAEETGLASFELGPAVWYREQMLIFEGEPRLSKETYVVARVHALPLSQSGWTDAERSSLLEMRWWTLPELESTNAVIYPLALPSRARELAALLASNAEVRELEVID